MMKKFVKYVVAGLFVIPFCVGSTVSAQTVLDGPYVKEHTPTRKVIPYTHLREADVMWAKRIWRVIDLREKMNHPLYYPIEPINDRKSLFDIIKQALMVDISITAYYPGPLLDDDEFKVPMLTQEIKAMFTTIDTTYTENLETGDFEPVIQTIELESREIMQYKLKEDWFFDRQRSVLDVRIIGIAPMKEVRGDDGEVRGYAEMFWLYFPECRYVFANWDVFNRKNDAERRTFEDLFWKRMFSSYIIKEANVFDRRINEEYQGIDALLDAERIKNEIFLLEHDLWHF
jgi:gliding motility associated protien GldN